MEFNTSNYYDLTHASEIVGDPIDYRHKLNV